jgi:mRNA-degrading endonuclease RelE of RelBE toxin-antitoxin system
VKSRTTERFRDLLDSLPEAIRKQAHDTYQLFLENPFHPSLQFKAVSARNPTLWSVRVGIHYRAIGIRKDDDILWVWIGSHADYDPELRRS